MFLFLSPVTFHFISASVLLSRVRFNVDPSFAVGDLVAPGCWECEFADIPLKLYYTQHDHRIKWHFIRPDKVPPLDFQQPQPYVMSGRNLWY